MKKLFLILLVATFPACSDSSSSKEKSDTYIMQKGGMSSVPHEMPQPEENEGTNTKTKRETYRMEKGGMSSTGHEMK